MTREYYTVNEVAGRLGVTPEYVRELLRRSEIDGSGKIKGIKVGKEWRINPKSVDVFLGVEVDTISYKKDLRIKELEGKVIQYEVQINALKGMINTFNNLIHT